MRTEKQPARLPAVLLFLICSLTAASLAVLVYGYCKVDQIASRNRVCIVPKDGYSTGVSAETLDEMNEKKCMLTYETSQKSTVQTLLSSYPVVIKGTNYTYSSVMRYTLRSGGFFTKEAMTQQSKYAVLNEKAAFEIFGGINIVGNEITWNHSIYRVVGVISDGDSENLNIYVPIVHTGSQPSAWFAVMDSGRGISYEVVQSIFTNIGVTADRYDLINLDAQNRVIRERAAAAAALTAWVFLFAAIRLLFLSMWRRIRMLREATKQVYWNKLITGRPLDILGLLLTAGLAAAVTAFWMKLSTYCVETFLTWRLQSSLFGSHLTEYSSRELRLLQSLHLMTAISFIAFVILLAFLSAYFWFRRNTDQM